MIKNKKRKSRKQKGGNNKNQKEEDDEDLWFGDKEEEEEAGTVTEKMLKEQENHWKNIVDNWKTEHEERQKHIKYLVKHRDIIEEKIARLRKEEEEEYKKKQSFVFAPWLFGGKRTRTRRIKQKKTNKSKKQ